MPANQEQGFAGARRRPPRQFRVLYLCSAGAMGGSVFSLLDLLRHLRREEFQPVAVVASDDCREFGERLAQAEVEKVNVRMRFNGWLSRPWASVSSRPGIMYRAKAPGRFGRHLLNAVRLASLMRRLRIDIVHTNDELLIDAALGALLARRPHIWHVRSRLGHDGLLTHCLGHQFALRVMNALSRKVIVNSRATLEPWQRAGLVEKVTLIHNGVDTERYACARGKLRAEYGLGDETQIVAMVSTCPEFDGLHHFVEAAIRVSQVLPTARFFMVGKLDVGDQEYVRKAKSMLVAHGVGSSFIFTGFRHDLPELYPDIDVLVEPMLNGSWSRVVLEAMAAGVPIVAVEQDQRSDFVKHGETGILVRSQHDLGAAVVGALANPQLVRAMAERARQHVRDCFSNGKYAERVMRVYRECLL